MQFSLHSLIQSYHLGALDSTVYTAGPRGFRPRGKNIVRKYDLNQNGPRAVGSPDDPHYDPYEDPSYDFSFRTRTYNRDENANRQVSNNILIIMLQGYILYRFALCTMSLLCTIFLFSQCTPTRLYKLDLHRFSSTKPPVSESVLLLHLLLSCQFGDHIS